MALMGAGQTRAQTPQPVHVLSSITGRPETTRMAPGTGQRSEQTVQSVPRWARQLERSIQAVPILSGRPGRSTPGSQARMQGVSGHITQAAVGSSMGVPAAWR